MKRKVQSAVMRVVIPCKEQTRAGGAQLGEQHEVKSEGFKSSISLDEAQWEATEPFHQVLTNI